jgi:hypothetical protein
MPHVCDPSCACDASGAFPNPPILGDRHERSTASRHRPPTHAAARRLAGQLGRLVAPCRAAWGDRAALEALLDNTLAELPACKYLYLLDREARQVTANLSRQGRCRSTRPRSQPAALPGEALAGAELFPVAGLPQPQPGRPSLTAVQRITDADGALLGFLGADFDLRDLPLTRELYRQSDQWLQLKGDPAIRGGLFYQQRVESLMDGRIDAVLDLFAELITEHGVFHGKLHFSSSRATIWSSTTPIASACWTSRTSPTRTSASPIRSGTTRTRPRSRRRASATSSAAFKALRFMDENIYLRSGSLNIFNGIVGLNFSCDGSHYMRWDEFLDKDLDLLARHRDVLRCCRAPMTDSTPPSGPPPPSPRSPAVAGSRPRPTAAPASPVCIDSRDAGDRRGLRRHRRRALRRPYLSSGRCRRAPAGDRRAGRAGTPDKGPGRLALLRVESTVAALQALALHVAGPVCAPPAAASSASAAATARPPPAT